MFENLKNLSSLLGQAREMGQKMQAVQAELARKTVEGDAGAGAVRVVMNGRLEMLSLHLDRPMLATLAGEGQEQDQQMIEELIVAAVNAAMAKAQALAQEELSKAMGGLNLPGMEKMLGGGG